MDKCYYFQDTSSGIVKLYFSNIPPASLRRDMKINGWRYNPEEQYWYASIASGAERYARSIGAKAGGELNKNQNTSNRSSSGFTSKTQEKLKKFGLDKMNEKQLEYHFANLNGPTPKCIKPPAEIANSKSMGCVICLGWSGQLTAFGITEDVKYQDSKRNIFWIDREISQRIISGLLRNKPWFFYKGEVYLITQYSDTLFFKNIFHHGKIFSNSLELAEIWIYLMKMPCYKHPEKVESVTAYVYTDKDHQLHPININYCSGCGKYYINLEQYQSFAQRYGLPMVRLMQDKNINGFADYSLWAEESMLHIMGYNVSEKDNLSDEERHRILKHALNTGTYKKPELLSHLEFQIYQRKDQLRFQNACSKWRNDLNFVRSYQLDTQRKILGAFKY